MAKQRVVEVRFDERSRARPRDGTRFERLMLAEMFAYRKWLDSGCKSQFWEEMTKSLNRKLRAHPDYLGVR